MDLASLGRVIAARRSAQGLTLIALASAAGVGRSTLAALEAGRLPELGFNKVARICAAAGIVLETRQPLLDQPRTLRRRRAAAANGPLALTRETIGEVIAGGDIRAWQELAEAVHIEESGRLAASVRRVVGALQLNDPKVSAFVALLPGILRKAVARDAEHPPRFGAHHVKLGASL